MQTHSAVSGGHLDILEIVLIKPEESMKEVQTFIKTCQLATGIGKLKSKMFKIWCKIKVGFWFESISGLRELFQSLKNYTSQHYNIDFLLRSV